MSYEYNLVIPSGYYEPLTNWLLSQNIPWEDYDLFDPNMNGSEVSFSSRRDLDIAREHLDNLRGY